MEVILWGLIGSLGMCFVFLVRNCCVLNFRLKTLREENAFLSGHMSQWKGSFPRYDEMPEYLRMVLEFWKPINHYKKPLSDYYDMETK